MVRKTRLRTLLRYRQPPSLLRCLQHLSDVPVVPAYSAYIRFRCRTLFTSSHASSRKRNPAGLPNRLLPHMICYTYIEKVAPLRIKLTLSLYRR